MSGKQDWIPPNEAIRKSKKSERKTFQVYTCLRKNRNENKMMQPNAKRTGQNKRVYELALVRCGTKS